MKKLLIGTGLLCLLVNFSLKAQESHAGIKGGINLSSLTTDGNSDKNLKIGFHAGVYDKIPVGESFAIQPELLYSVKGIKLNYDDNTFADGETRFNLNYIDLPVKFVFNLSDDFEFQFGPYVSYLVNANMATDAELFDSFPVNSADEIDRENFHSIDYGFTAGLGFDLNPLIVGFNYNMGLTPVAKDDQPSKEILDDAKNAVIQVYVGIMF